MEINKKNFLPWWMRSGFRRVYSEPNKKKDVMNVTAEYRWPRWFWYCVIFVIGWAWFGLVKFAGLFKKKEEK